MKTIYRRMPPWARALLLSLLVLAPLSVWASNVNRWDLSNELRTTTYEYVPVLTSTTISNPGGTAMTTGTQGTVWSWTIKAAGITSAVTGTQAVAGLPYPGRLVYGIKDVTTTSGALTCTGLTITGEDPFGHYQIEKDFTVSESLELTTKSWGRVTKVTIDSCTSALAIEAGDNFVLRLAGEYVALPRRMRAYTDITSVCQYRYTEPPYTAQQPWCSSALEIKNAYDKIPTYVTGKVFFERKTNVLYMRSYAGTYWTAAAQPFYSGGGANGATLAGYRDGRIRITYLADSSYAP